MHDHEDHGGPIMSKHCETLDEYDAATTAFGTVTSLNAEDAPHRADYDDDDGVCVYCGTQKSEDVPT
jgi:hypothetical protein